MDMEEGVYEELRKLLDLHPCGCPPAPEIYQILEILFTPEEARVALGLGFRPLPAEEVSRRCGIGLEETRARLESMADKGVVFCRDKEGVRGYALLPVMPGLFEFPYMKGYPPELRPRIDALWREYLPKLSRNFGTPSTSFSRIVPIQEEVESRPGVLPYEMVYEMIQKARVTGIARCACRELENKCDAPREACMLFDETCTFLVERGFGRYLSKEEMIEKLREFDRAGLVHQVNNAQERLTFVCNCCPCCCGLLRANLRWGNRNVYTRSAFTPVLDEDACSGCATCAEERCPVQAVTLVEGLPAFDRDKCIGCGLCVTGCPSRALRLERGVHVPEPPRTTGEMGMRILADQGKLEGFMERMR
ncbi:MAG: 4Fe-4S binding protein [Candidatus Geothermincolales bacterium]